MSAILRGALMAALIGGVSCAGTALAGGNASAGAEKAKTCAACHGEAGAAPTVPDYPKLAGQHRDYLEHTLNAYKSGTRKNAIMNGMAAALSKQDIKDLAAYFSKQQALELKY
jgi:cytochrome c553